MTKMYILNDAGEPEACDDIMTWGRWMENGDNRRVALDEVGDYRISTIFLGLDHSFSFHPAPPILYETMVFKDRSEVSGFTRRYETRDEALAGHAKVRAELLG